VGLDDAFRAERERRRLPERRRRLRDRLHDVDEELGVRLRPVGAGSGLPAAGHEPASAASASTATASSSSSSSSSTSTTAPAAASSSSSTTSASATAAAACSTSSSNHALPRATRDRAQARPGPRADQGQALLGRPHPSCSLEESRQGDRPKPPGGSRATARRAGQLGSRP
jgi:hypothetical protein